MKWSYIRKKLGRGFDSISLPFVVNEYDPQILLCSPKTSLPFPQEVKIYAIALKKEEFQNLDWTKFENCLALVFNNSNLKSKKEWPLIVVLLPLSIAFNYLSAANHILASNNPFYRLKISSKLKDYFFVINGTKTKGIVYCKSCPKFEDMVINKSCCFGLINCIHDTKPYLKVTKIDISLLEPQDYVKPKEFFYLEPFVGYDFTYTLTEEEKEEVLENYKTNSKQAVITRRLTTKVCKHCIFYKNKKKKCGYRIPRIPPSGCGGPFYIRNNVTWAKVAESLFEPWELHVLSYYFEWIKLESVKPLFSYVLYRKRAWPIIHIPISSKRKYLPHRIKVLLSSKAYAYSTVPTSSYVTLVIPSAVFYIGYLDFCKLIKEKPVTNYTEELFDRYAYHFNFSSLCEEEKILRLYATKYRIKTRPDVSYYEYYNVGDVPWNYRYTSTRSQINLLKPTLHFNVISDLTSREVLDSNNELINKVYDDPSFKPSKYDFSSFIKC